MVAFYWTPPSAADLAGTAYRETDYPRPELVVWPDNTAAFNLFCKYQTQWRVGMNGPIGLDYTVFLSDLARRRVSDDEQDELMDGIRAIEQSALNVFHKSK